MTLQEIFERRNRYFAAEPLNIGKGMFLVDYRKGRTGRVPHHAIVRDDGTHVGYVKALHGYQKGLFSAFLFDPDRTQTIEGKFPKIEDAIAFMVDIAQRYR